jgi:myosin-1
MDVVGITPQEQHDIIRVVAGILHLGNITFQDDAKGNAQIADPAVAQLACSLLGVDQFTLSNAMLFRVIQTGGAGQSSRSSTYNVPQNTEQVTPLSQTLSSSYILRRHMAPKMHWQEKFILGFSTG